MGVRMPDEDERLARIGLEAMKKWRAKMSGLAYKANAAESLSGCGS